MNTLMESQVMESPVIEMFELCLINQYNITDENEYMNIFKILKSIRLPNNEIEEIKKLIIYI